MFKKLRVGDREIIEPIEMPENTRKIIQAVLIQNSRILAMNEKLIEAQLMTSMFVFAKEED